MADITCKKCDAINFFHIEQKGVHKIAYCDNCGAYIKHVAYDKQKFYIGKFKGMAVEDCIDLNYLEWYLKSIAKISPAMKTAIEERIFNLNAK